jgi:hypothetical protein
MAATSLWEMRGRVREIAPSRSKEMIDGFLNRSIRNLVDQHNWADLLKTGIITIPQNFTAGTVNLTPGSNQVVGVGTGWPVNDALNTVLGQAVNEVPAYVQVFPGAGAMSIIKPGMYLLLDQETPASTEIITVTSVGPTSFYAYCQFPHASGISLQKSSLANMQFQGPDYVYTVQAVLTPTLLQIDMPYGNVAQAGLSYQIVKAYVQVSPTCRRLLYAWDAIAGQPVGVGKTVDWLNMADPQRTSSQQPQELVSTFPAPGGIMQFECWPYQQTPYGIAVVYQDGWPTLKYDTDLSPPFINPEVFISSACADALRTKVIPRVGQQDPYFDINGSDRHKQDYKDELDKALQSDEGRYLKGLQDARQSLATGAVYNFWRSHCPWPTDFNG